MQISIDFLPDYGNKQAMTGDEACITYDTALVVRSLRNIIAILPATLGIHAKQLSLATSNISPAFARIIAGSSSISTSTFPNSHTNIKLTSLELTLAKFAINYLYPAWQYTLALIVVDTWIYFTHRLCHINSTLYPAVHAQHHRLYVSYAYGAVYAHWLETLFLDILSFVLVGEIDKWAASKAWFFERELRSSRLAIIAFISFRAI